ncbi:MAG: ATP-binding cassette domain-containing protein [Clostridia bacterium]|nr:ATP-binding cassette domain-containing protein [Clostridia bacterium]
MLKVDNAVKIFSQGTPNEHKALNSLSIHLEKGEFVTIVGSNGAGKSTLFNAICGNFLLDSGSIVVDGKDITFMKEYKRASFIGRVFQDPMKGTAPNMTIEENLALAYSRSRSGPFGIAVRKKDHDMFAEALSEFGMGLEDRMKTKVGLLSGGQRQVVTLLMCTLVTPKLLLLDEHTAALDPATAEKVMEITNKIVSRNNITTMMITHNMNSALKTGTRTIMMDSGEIILDTSGEERAKMTLDDLLQLYSLKKKEAFANDRMLLN